MIARYCVLIVALTGYAAYAAPVPYDLIPVTNHMTEGRWAPACAALADGRRALIAGGFNYALGECVSSADIYELKSNRFTPSHCRLACPRDFAQALTLSDGTVLIAGGFNDVLGSVRAAEIYDPATDSFRAISGMNVPRELFQLVGLTDGRVMAIGGL